MKMHSCFELNLSILAVTTWLQRVKALPSICLGTQPATKTITSHLQSGREMNSVLSVKVNVVMGHFAVTFATLATTLVRIV
jgi:hypothetical protein